MKKDAVILIVIVLAGLAVLGTNLCLNRGDRPKTPPYPPLQEGREQGPGSNGAQSRETAWGNAPDISLTMLDGRILKLSDFKGNIIVLNLWVAGCAYCRMQMADLNKLHARHKDSGVVVIGVNLDGCSMLELQTFCKREKLLYLVAAGDYYAVAGGYGVSGFPTTFIIDQKGNIAHKYIGYQSHEIFTLAARELASISQSD